MDVTTFAPESRAVASVGGDSIGSVLRIVLLVLTSLSPGRFSARVFFCLKTSDSGKVFGDFDGPRCGRLQDGTNTARLQNRPRRRTKPDLHRPTKVDERLEQPL